MLSKVRIIFKFGHQLVLFRAERIWSAPHFVTSVSEICVAKHIVFIQHYLAFTMNVNPLKSSSDRLSESSTFSLTGESLDEFHRDLLHADTILGYQFEPRRDSYSASDKCADINGEEHMSIKGETSLVCFWAT